MIAEGVVGARGKRNKGEEERGGVKLILRFYSLGEREEGGGGRGEKPTS